MNQLDAFSRSSFAPSSLATHAADNAREMKLQATTQVISHELLFDRGTQHRDRNNRDAFARRYFSSPSHADTVRLTATAFLTRT